LKSHNLKQKAYKAILWSSIDRFSEQVLRFVFSIFLARLLLPSDFGLIGIAYLISEVARIFMQSGFGSALINKQNVKEIDICSVFYTNIFLSVLIYVVIFIFAPLIGDFYKNIQLVSIIRVLSLSLIVNSIGTIQTVLMTKNIDFKRQAYVSVPTTLLSGGVGVYFACINWGVWALVVQSLLRTTIYTVLMWVFHKWRPRAIFSFKAVFKLFQYSSGLLIGDVANVVFLNIYTILIGKFYSFEKLGYFSRAQQTIDLPVNSLWAILGRVSFPLLSTIKNNKNKYLDVVRRSIRELSAVYFPALFISMALAGDAFTLIFGKQWEDSIGLYQLLCFAAIIYPNEKIYHTSIIALGNSSVPAILKVVKYSSVLLCIWLTHKNGLMVMLKYNIVVQYFNYFITMIYIKKRLQYSFWSQITDVLPAALASMLCCLSLFVIKNIFIGISFPLLFGKIVLSVLLYVLFAWVFRINSIIDKLKYVYEFIKSRKK
jgi:teichuronic acid exporter